MEDNREGTWSQYLACTSTHSQTHAHTLSYTQARMHTHIPTHTYMHMCAHFQCSYTNGLMPSATVLEVRRLVGGWVLKHLTSIMGPHGWVNGLQRDWVINASLLSLHQACHEVSRSVPSLLPTVMSFLTCSKTREPGNHYLWRFSHVLGHSG